MQSLIDLIEKTLAGEITAYEVIIKRFQAMATGYAYALLKDRDLASDASQEAFIEAYYNLASLQNRMAFPGWLKRIVFKQCDRIRRGCKESIPADENLANQLKCSEESQDQKLEEQETHQLLRLSADTLSSEQRTVLLLFYIRDYTLKEISSFLELPVSTIKKRLFDARKNLKERMNKMEREKIATIEPKEIFSVKIIEELLQRTDLLKIAHNPVSQVLELVKKALPEFEFVESEEVVKQSVVNLLGDDPNSYYHLDNGELLRTSTDPSLITVLAKRNQASKIILTGRAFRPGKNKKYSANVFHMFQIAIIDTDLKREEKREMMLNLIETIAGKCELYYEPFNYEKDGRKYFAKLPNGDALSLCVEGVFNKSILEKIGIDSSKFDVYSCCFGLDRLAMLKFGIDSIQDLYRSEYL